MKKFFYILVAVFTMISVNAFGYHEDVNSVYRLHYNYPGGNDSTDVAINEIVYKVETYETDGFIIYSDKYDEFVFYADEAHTKVIDTKHPDRIKIPTCKGYKFIGYYATSNYKESKLHGDNYYKVFYKDGTGGYKYDGCDLYAYWEKDTENYIWEDDGSGFYGTDQYGDIDWDSFTPWNHMYADKIPHTYLYLHYAYPGCNKEVVNQTIYVDETSFDNKPNEIYRIYAARAKSRTVFYKDETKKEVVDLIDNFPKIKGYRFVAFKSESGFTIINSNGINEWHDSKAVPTPHLYGYWEKDTENYQWSIDGKKFYDKTGQWKRGKWVPWDYMKDEETTTGINEVEDINEVKSNKAEGIYTLNGVKVNEITKSGIYIINGKKVVK